MQNALASLGYAMLDKGLVPDIVLRRAIRYLCQQRLTDISSGSFEAKHAAKVSWIEQLKARPTIAEETQTANEQHYEVPTKFMLSCLGPFAKYSCCLYPGGRETLAEAECLMMESYCEKARLRDGQQVLDLGCGWGSLSLYLAKKYPRSRITALSNSATQKAHIDSTAQSRGLTNIHVITANVNTFDFETCTQFDRILSIEMFEHMKNYRLLMSKVASWLRPNDDPSDESLCFVHIFCHRTTPYHFEKDDGWMSQTFFSGGTMPSHDLLLYFQEDLTLVSSWYLSGQHYARTAEDWLKMQDEHRAIGLAELEQDAGKRGLGEEHGRVMFNRFRVFYMACAEFFAMNDGQEWGVGHYLFKRK